ncbi:Putative uric acid-xanthine permease [Komagataella phaffii CBS 7435]|uniref:Uric acid-xanthine permease n=2 Tax=Komagataella phaffii TaxID=460519 RepID=C4QYP6_KOMPG|nr:Hypothetical protein PAS_chr1-4_0518 [Komagataella phaffii GS115]AOA61216.1 GQ67_01634T0 [Komagataella phaffii]CAH2447195.1 Putative uric acid-xanthine permease [Komagataella phaffii CBS 7435]AOA65478.1 GQ68_01650T0 [Komagataella phaffii GS115]CAY68370.1 Hypothetical protein PAS_chr1-4_0518 [Komagataella phaffii GS115]CCA37437.1 Putative uric acid-xanthine permease [Komagataella phaffii CBS 7435]
MEKVSSNLRRVKTKFTTKEGLIGDYNYSQLFIPKIPIYSDWKQRKSGQMISTQPFFGLNDSMPVLLGAILGLQHALAMLAGIMTPPIIISGVANFDVDTTQYLVSASLIISGLLSMIQITRFHFYKTPYYLGTGLISMVGTSFATITIVTKAIPMMYVNGQCPTAEDGTLLPCPDGYGSLLGTAACCSLLEITLSFMPPKVLQRVFPPLVTGPVVLLIGTHLVESGMMNLVGGCGEGNVCVVGSHSAPWGSAQFIGLGFLVYVTIVICEKWGSPIMKSCAVIMGLLMGCIVAAATGYFSHAGIDAAPAVTFPWVKTFKLTVYGPAVLPMLAVFVVLMMEAIGDITATCEVSRTNVEGKEYESRIQGGVLADGLNGCLAALMTMTPVSTFSQNNGVISITKCASRTVGYWCCFFLIIMGIFAKFAAALVAIPRPVLGGMTTFLFTSVAVSGIKIIATTPFTRRDRFVLTASLMFGIAAVLIPDWFSYVFTYDGDNGGLQGFFDAIVLVMETGFAVTGFLGVILNLFLPQELDDNMTADMDVYEQQIVTDDVAVSSSSEDNKSADRGDVKLNTFKAEA